MLALILRRIIQTIVVIFIVSIITFALMNLIPGAPVLRVLGYDAKQSDIDALRTQLRLDDPWLTRYGYWLSDIFHGNLGKSIIYNETAARMLATRLPITAYLGFLSFIVAIIFGIPAGILSAMKRGRWLDTLISSSANVGIAIPAFWLGILFIYTLALKFGLLPTNGFTSPFEDLGVSLKQTIMPVACLAAGPVAIIARQTRSAMLEVIHQDYVRTAWSKGLSEMLVIQRHVIKNGLIPVVTLLGMFISQILGGSVLIETVFNIPGMGRLLATSVYDKDYVMVQVCILVIATIISLTNLAIDISYSYIDPRIHYD